MMAALMLSLTGCTKGETPDTKEDGVITVAPDVNNMDDVGDETDDINEANKDNKKEDDSKLDNPKGDTKEDLEKAYASVLDIYYTAVAEQWDWQKMNDEKLNYLFTYQYEGNALENVGYAFMDLNGDGVDELLLGVISKEEPADNMIYEAYTLVDHKPVNVFSSQERNRYYISNSEEGVTFIQNEGSSSAAQSVWYYYILDGSNLKLVQGILYDSMADEKNPWFMTYDTDWDSKNDTPTDEKMAQDIIDSYEKNRVLLEYNAFKSYK